MDFGLNAFEPEAPPDADAIATELEVEQSVQQNVVTSSVRCITLAVAVRSRRR